MGEHSKIAWTENTWSPWWGCREISPACQNCYARRLAHRFGRDCWGDHPRRMMSEDHWGKPLAWNRKAKRDGRIIPVFPSMCDPFEDRPELVEPRGRLIRVIRRTPGLFWLLLTKRPEHAADMLEIAGYNPHGGDSKNLGLGVTVESNDYTWRIAELLKVPAALHFISAEPMLREVDVSRWLEPLELEPCVNCGMDSQPYISEHDIEYDEHGDTKCPDCGFMATVCSPRPDDLPRLGWAVAGCASGPKRRPTNIAHIRSLRDQCVAAGIPFFLKQMDVGGKIVKMPLLDGRTWDEGPEVLR